MMCLKHMMIYAVLLPTPAAPPIFLLLFGVSVFYAVRPCGYCLILFSILLLSTSPASPFAPARPSPDPADLPLADPWPSRTWLGLNGGRVWDPSLVAYRLPLEKSAESAPLEGAGDGETLARAQGDAAPVEEDQGRVGWTKMWARARGFFKASLGASPPSPPAPTATAEVSVPHPGTSPDPDSASALDSDTSGPLPPGYIDLRLPYLGLGFVLDLNWRRTVPGLTWERAQWLRTVRRQRARATQAKSHADKAGAPAGLLGSLGAVAGDTAKRIPLFGLW